MTASRKANDADRNIGWRMKLARTSAVVKANDAAKHIGVTYTQLNGYERGDNRISALSLAKLANLYDRPIWWFLEGVVPESRTLGAKPITSARVNAKLEKLVLEHTAAGELSRRILERAELARRSALTATPQQPPQRHSRQR